MSIRVMSEVWELDLPPSEKLVLLSLADWAHDNGWCHPSIATVARKTGVSERTVQRMLREAEKAGLLQREEIRGKGCRYRVTPRQGVTPDKVAPVTNDTETPDTVSPNTSGTIISDVANATSARRTKKTKFVLPKDIPAEPWDGFVEMRRTIGKPLSMNAKNLAVTRLRKLRDEDGWPPGEVLNHSTLNSYQGLFPPKERRNDRPSQPASRNTAAVEYSLRGLDPHATF